MNSTTYYLPPHPIPIYLMLSILIPSHLIISRAIRSYPISSHPAHPIQSYPIPWHPPNSFLYFPLTLSLPPPPPSPPLANLCKLQIHTSTVAAAIVVWCPLLCKLRIIPRTVLSCLLREERGASGHRHPEARRGVPRRWWVGTVSQQCRCCCFFVALNGWLKNCNTIGFDFSNRN